MMVCAVQTVTPVEIGWSPGYRPSNSTDGDYFRAKWCDECERDHENHGPHGTVGPGCPILVDTFAGLWSYPNDGPAEWLSQRTYRTIEVKCSAFRTCGPCRTAEEAERLKHWPTEMPGRYQQPLARPTEGQETLF